MNFIGKYIGIITLLLIGLNPFFVSGQGKIEGQAPKVVQEGERFQLVYTINAKSDTPNINIPDAFQILSGPGVSQSQRMEYINGKMNSSISITYTYILQAQKEGEFTIQPVSVSIDGKTATSNAVTIEVVKGNNAKQQPAKGLAESKANGEKVKSDPDFFVRVHVDRKSVYQGEGLVATLKLYTTLNLNSFEKVDFPKFTGFYKEEIETVSQIQLQRENVNGKIYQAGTIAKYLLMPQRSGIIEIDPLNVEVIVSERVRSNDPFDSFFGGNVRRYKVANSSPIVKIDVKPLPEPRPDDFTGGVGQLKLNASVSRNSLKTNDALNLKVKFTGTGNIRFLDNPKINFPVDFEVYDPKKDVNIKVTANGATGVVLWDYLVIPRHAGDFTIPEISYSYFDPSSKSYKKLKAGPFAINVEQGAEQASQGTVSGPTRQGVQNIGSDIRYIQTGNLNLSSKGQYLFNTPLFWAGYIIPLLIFIIYLVVKRKHEQDRSDIVKVRNKRAAKISRSRLKSARKYIKDNKEAQVYDEVLRALWQYLGDKLAIDQARLSRDSVLEEMKNRNVDPEVVAKVVDLADICEMARYAPTAVKTPAAEAYAQAVELLVQLEKAVK
ncbi:MAG: BatD family protein [Salinivirgaceae bacterium]|nr:BatD family protein [Salinivirgaceae bacterium]